MVEGAWRLEIPGAADHEVFLFDVDNLDLNFGDFGRPLRIYASPTHRMQKPPQLDTNGT